jgi:hypothetical protein
MLKNVANSELILSHPLCYVDYAKQQHNRGNQTQLSEKVHKSVFKNHAQLMCFKCLV